MGSLCISPLVTSFIGHGRAAHSNAQKRGGSRHFLGDSSFGFGREGPESRINPAPTIRVVRSWSLIRPTRRPELSAAGIGRFLDQPEDDVDSELRIPAGELKGEVGGSSPAG